MIYYPLSTLMLAFWLLRSDPNPRATTLQTLFGFSGRPEEDAVSRRDLWVA